MKLRSEPHAATRARERFGLDWTDSDLHQLRALAKVSPTMRQRWGAEAEIRVCFFRGTLMKVGIRGITVTTVCQLNDDEAARWERDAMLAAGRFERRAG